MNAKRYTPAAPDFQGPGLSRRDALASLGALALAASSTVALAGGPDEPSELGRLIEAYLVAEDAWSEAESECSSLEAAHIADLKANPVVVRCVGRRDWSFEIDQPDCGFDAYVRGHTSDELGMLMRQRGGESCLEELQASIATLLSREAENHARLKAAQRTVDQRAADLGLPQAYEREDATAKASAAALDAVMSYRPKTLLEVREFFDFCRSERGFGEHTTPNERYVRMMFDAMASVVVDGHA